jgi:hypothetical protein
MKVLHVYSPNDTMAAQFVAVMTKSVSDAIECRTACTSKEARHIVNDWHPDILHLHGNCSPLIPRRSALTRLVVSPHGSTLSSELTDKAFVIIARSEIEQQLLKQSHEKGRYAVILNPVISRTITATEAAEQLQAVYQRVLESDILERLDQPSLLLLRLLLKTAICGDRQWVEAELSGLTAPPDLPPASLRQLQIYAELEGVSPLFSLGIELLGLYVNADLNTAKQAAASCFLPASYEQPQSSTNFSVEALTERIDKEMAHNQLSLLRLCELDRSLRQQDVDEPRLLAQLKNEKRLGLFRSLLAILHEQTGLDEGFMPCKPKYDRKTKKIRNSIKHHLSLL